LNRRLRIYRRRAVGIFVVLGVIVGAVLGLALAALDGSDIGRPALHGAVVGTLAGLLIGVTEEYFVPELGRRVGFATLNSFRFVVYAVGLAVSVLLGNVIPRIILEDLSPAGALAVYLDLGNPGRDMIVGVVTAFAATFLIQLRRLHNREELWHLFTGRYHSPRVEERIFLFVDLADSTGTAEALGPTRYSRYLRDVFRDMAEPILVTRGLLYQHAGDAAIVSWRFGRGLREGACVRCFMGIAAALDRNGSRYETTYGCRPRVRGAIHGGEVVATWVGEAKRELAFHGDTLNTVARLQGLASRLDRSLLVSDVLRSHLDLPGFQTECLGSFDLRGRRASAEVYAVTPVNSKRVAW
jgi:adenylate cyclase